MVPRNFLSCFCGGGGGGGKLFGQSCRGCRVFGSRVYGAQAGLPDSRGCRRLVHIDLGAPVMEESGVDLLAEAWL